jgi:putative ABC transport system ATP-binding protein
MLQLTNLHKAYRQGDGTVPVLQGVSFDLKRGESAALLGESGSGKSTLLHLIAGLDTPDSGDIHFLGRSTRQFGARDWTALRRRDLSLVFQQYHLIPTLNVRDNVRLQARLSGQPDTGWEAHLMGRLGLKELTGRLPHQLSGGQQQRVAIARALLHRPALVLAD